jgi:glutamate/tyrosine decarboxylase-like PLP-dependent enzyme
MQNRSRVLHHRPRSAQYYQLLRLGRTGYARIMHNLDTIAGRLADGIMETGVCARVRVCARV